MMPRRGRAFAVLLAALLMVAWVARRQQGQQPAFDHAKHAKLFVSCTLCHAGVTRPGAPVFPAAAACQSCHNGTVVKQVGWQPRTTPRASNLKFDHARHASLRRGKGDTASSCGDCHADRGAGWMQVRAPVAPQCVTCHTQGRGDHLALPDTACATCHLTLARATALSKERIARFPSPVSHQSANFMSSAGHGALARKAAGGARVAQSCATCHARDFCASCHVNAPETAAIQALESDARSLVLPHVLKAPATHAARDFERKHGSLAGSDGASCRTCHTQESCLTCHRAAAPPAVRMLAVAGPGRGAGAITIARLPSSHGPVWKTQHGPIAASSTRSCSSCHQRQECLTCHVPNSSRRGSYHPATYLTRHPADAYSRASSCADCHNTAEFCQTCHNQAGLTVKRGLLGPAGYHDNNRQFFFGHGQAARQGLESCVSCHVERDCLTCHSVVKGRSFNPHGPGFNPELMLKKNPQLCMACHGTAIPRARIAH
jgi:hypothetical protein